MTLHPDDDPVAAVDELAGCTAPWLYGVRHHSPACAAALTSLLDAYQPTAIALEMPADLESWIEWLAHPEAGAPLAVAAVAKDGGDLGFYPFADFSPELVAVRWARANNVPVHAIDLPSAERGGRDRSGASLGIHERLSHGNDDSWEHLVEGPGTCADPEKVRRAALLYGWALRIDAVRGSGVSELDLAREAHMRQAIGRLLADPDYAAFDGADDAAAEPAPPPSSKKVRKKTPGKYARRRKDGPPNRRSAEGNDKAESQDPIHTSSDLGHTSGSSTGDLWRFGASAANSAEDPNSERAAKAPPKKAPAKKAPAKKAPTKTSPSKKPVAEVDDVADDEVEDEAPPTKAAPRAEPKGPAKKKGGPRVAAIVGSFHAAALLPRPTLWKRPKDVASERVELVSSLIPYGFELLDERSGYPAGIRDPMWQQRLFEAQREKADIRTLVASCLVEITRGIRQRGLPASVPDAHAAAEVANSLALLRGLATPGRRELVEAVQTALTHGELMGRGRIVAKSMELVMVGRSRGHLAADTPRSGLAPHVLELMDELKLPRGAMQEPEDLRLDPLRSPLDRRRHVALARMRACGIPYGTEQESVAAGGVESLTSSWKVMFTPSTEAVIELAGLRGVTLRQAATGALRADHGRLVADDKLTAMALVELAGSAAEAGAGELVREWLLELAGPRLAEATLTELIELVALIDRVSAGHVVGLPEAGASGVVPGEIDEFVPPAIDRAMITSTAVASILGLAGSESLTDAKALAELVHILQRPDHQGLGDGRLRWSVDQLVETGTPLISGAAGVVQVLIGTRTAEELSVTIGAWLDAGVDIDTRRALAQRLRGAIAIAGPLLEAAPVFLDGLCERVERMSDADFLPRAAALREGFETLSTAGRRRLLQSLGDRLGENDARGQGLDVTLSVPAALLAAAAEADAAGRAAADRIPRPELAGASVVERAVRSATALPDHHIPVRDRWRMILGHEREQMKPQSRRAARALDELYGNGHGEGSREELGGGGQEAGYPTVRAWRDEIEALFGASVFEEVAAQAATQGRVGALLELDPTQVTPSVELLEQVLSLKGGLGESQLGRLRTLIKHVVDELVRELAVRVRPALHGALSPRATRRPSNTLHLARTVSANLARTRIENDRVTLIPERLFFKARSRRHMDWHVVLVVDVSGSMEPSVIYSAMMAAILSGVPWIDVRFVAFSTEIVDLSEHAHDPLALLLEVSVGGGTHIAKGLRYAKSLITVPQRTIVICVSDFEEGFSIDGLLGEVRSLVEAGVTCLGLAALDDRGAPRYAVPIAELVAGAGMPVAALTPLELARWIGDHIR